MQAAASAAAIDPAVTLDAKGLNCPLPILRARKALSGMASGEVLRVLATDPGSKADFDAFCRQTGNPLLSTGMDGDTYEYNIRKG